MKFSEIWLREWANPSINNIELTQQLTMIGFKVDESKSVSNIFYGVMIGEIIECKTHPNFNNTSIIKVNNGSKKLLKIICNSNNCRKNIKVVVANVGAILPNGKKVTLNIIQGQISEGILCTFKTLEMFDNAQNIIELPKDAPIGKNFYDYLHLDDKIIDINITPNRGDCLSVMGIAREIAIINHLKLKNLTSYIVKPIIHDTATVFVDAPSACPKYLIRIIKNINTTIPTPLWIKEKLRRCGILCSNNIITDIINYVLIELGHPVYAFDYKKITGNVIQVRFAKSKEIIKLYKKNIVTLLPNTLIIADNKNTISIAGIITSNQFCIHPHTNSIVLQSAFFMPSIIANQSKMYNIHSLSSARYIRGVDPNISQLTLERVTSLLLEHCQGEPGPITNITHDNLLPKPIPITLYRSNLNKILGFYITYQTVTDILIRLGFQIIELLKNDYWKVLRPTWRFDIFIEENIIAEIARIYGYNKIPNIAINTNLITSHNYSPTIPLSKIKSLLITRGYQEIITYSFVKPEIQKLLYPKKNPLKLKNPITKEMSSMRLSLWIGLIETMIYNQNRQQKNIKLFESGTCFMPNNTNDKKINQNLMIAGIRSGLRCSEHWDLTAYPTDFYDIKGDVETLLCLTNKFNFVRFKKSTHPALHPMQNAAIYLHDNNICIGYIGLIHPTIQEKLNIRSHVFVFELQWNLISQIISPKISEISKFPKNCRDISMIISNNISFESIINICKQIASDKLIDIKLSDVYTDSNIPKNCKSLTIKLFLQSKTHTLKEKEIVDIVNQCIITLKKHFRIILR